MKLSNQEIIKALDYIKDIQSKDEEQIIRDMQHQVLKQQHEDDYKHRVREHYS